MLFFLDRLISRLFYLLLFLTPLIFWPFSSELFEFNKIVFVYLLTAVTSALWLIKCILAGKLIFRRTALDIPIVVFLASLGISTILSIDVRTSLLGYYSRFHGGLLSYFSYSILYWAFVSNMGKGETKKSIFFLIASFVLVLLYGVLQHLGIDKNIWVQDVQNRIFSTLGQPNWLAAWTVAIMPLTWIFTLKKISGKQRGVFWAWIALSTLGFTVLLFTKSRSGLLGFTVADLVFWSAVFWKVKRKALSVFFLHHLIFLCLALVIGTPFTLNVPAPETGGTESGEIRKIVWEGTINLWKKYPVLGTGPETFAYSYYETRPATHNLVSEWNFLYNKAHNEYLNFASTTGVVGLSAYLAFILTAILQIGLGKKKNKGKPWNFALLAGFLSILVTNFFGFSVVPVALLFFIFPAFAIGLKNEQALGLSEHKRLTGSQKFILLIIITLSVYIVFKILVYWYADTLYSKGKSYNSSQNPLEAREALTSAVSLSLKEPVFWDELSKSTATLSVLLYEGSEEQSANELARVALSESDFAVSLSPRNLNFKRTQISIFERLSTANPTYLLAEKKALEDLIPFAPTDASLYYGLGLTEERLGQTEEALISLGKAIELKPNYKNARFAKALVLINLGKKEEAREELVYILEKIEPNDNLVREELEKIN